MEPAQAVITSAPYGQACTHCSKAKTRCVPKLAGKCERCHRMNKDCTPSTTVRKRQGITVTSSNKRVRLEDRLDDLVSLLQLQNAQKAREVISNPASDLGIEHPWVPQVWKAGAANKRATDLEPVGEAPHNDVTGCSNPFLEQNVITTSTTSYSTSESSAPLSSLVELSAIEAEQMLHRFRSLHLNNIPFIFIPGSKTAEELQHERPFFWLVIRAICTKSVVEQHKLGVQVRKVLSNQLLVECERDIDLLVGLLTYLGWSMFFARGRPYMCALCGLASSLVFDLRLDRKARDDSCSAMNPTLNCFKPYAFPKPPPSANRKTRTNEERRALLGCFFTTTIVSSYMRFEVARWKPNLEDAMRHLWEAPETPSDRLLVALVRAMTIVDDTVRMTSNREDQDVGAPSMFHIKALLASLHEVKSNLPDIILNDRLFKVQAYSTETVIYELAMFQSASTSRFKPLEYKRRDYLQACLEAAKNFMDCFLTIEAAAYPTLPFWIMIEYAHSAQVLYRLSLLDDPGWDRAMVRQTGNIIHYLEQVALKMDRAHELEGYNTNGSEDSLFSKAAESLRTTIPVWTVNLEQVGAIIAAQANGGTSMANEYFDPISLDFADDTWLLDMFMSWDGH